MNISLASIDGAAAGFVRHRFVRAMTASWVVLTIMGLLATIVYATVDTADAGDHPVTTLLVGVFVTALIVVPLVASAAVAVALVNAIDRRIIALLAAAVFGIAVVLMPLAALGGLMDVVGLVEEAPGQADPAFKTVAMVIFSALSAVVAWELFGWARWQLLATNDAFLATRGWRPRGWQVFSGLRNLMGLPAFISNFGRGRTSLTVLYFTVSLFNVGIAAVFALPVLTNADAKENQTTAFIVIGATLAALLLMNIVGVGRSIARLADQRATLQYQHVRQWDGRAPIVFLRTFDQDDERLPALVKHPILRLPAGVSGARTLDEILLEHGSPYGPVIAIGDPRDPVPPLGAARIFVPGEGSGWQEVVHGLVRSAQAIIMCPSDTEGVKWELNLLASMPQLRVAYLANPELPAETTLRLFRAIVPGATTLNPPADQMPIAAFPDGEGGWKVLTTSVRPSVQTYTIALNAALQGMLGHTGKPLVRPPRGRARA